MRSLGWAASGLALLLAAAPAAAQTKSLHWRLVHVSAELDADGRLHVRERQAMVFTGDWNGGERRFDIRKGQSLRLHGIRRIDAAGVAHELRSRQPPDVDEYTWADARTMRWRSRAPSDPPFRSTEIVYEIDYTLSNVLVFRDGTYRLDHDFAFPDRPGPIGRFVLELRLDRVWRPETAVPPQLTAGPLPQGEGYVVDLEMTHLGAALPAAVAHGSPGWRRLLLALLAAGALGRLALFWIRERSAGRLEPLVPASRIDAPWLGQNVFHLPAEVVGATWERSVGAAEVAAILARLEVEGRIETWADDTVPSVRHLRLVAPRQSLVDHERLLIDALLVDGRDETDTAEVRKHYKATGFDPASVIKNPLEKRVGELLGRENRGGAARALTVVLFVSAAGALGWALLREADVVPLAAAGASLVVYLVGLAFAYRWRRRVDGGALAALGLLVPIALLLAGVVFVDRLEPPASIAALGGSVALALGFIHSLLNRARATESPAALRLRKRLTAARAYLQDELRRGSPGVQESWFPHLLALGLAEQADQWSAARQAGPATVSTWHDDGPSRSSSSPSTPSPGFSAGGGRFGGAGATGSWAATAQAFSASIAAPSSSGSGGGGSSGGGSSSSSSSSGGGGGGGW